MREYKNAFRLLVRERTLLFKSLWRSYLAMILSAVLLFEVKLHLISTWGVSLGLMVQEKDSWSEAFQTTALPLLTMLGIVLGGALFVICAVWAHRRTKRLLQFLKQHELLVPASQGPWSRTKWGSILTLNGILLCGVVCVAALPLVVVIASHIATTLTIHSGTLVAVPVWSYFLTFLFVFFGMSTLVLSFLFIRITLLQNSAHHD